MVQSLRWGCAGKKAGKLMAKNWKNYLVKIIIPGTSGQDYVATGYPFREGCILTARHAIHQHDHDKNRPWRFLWRIKDDSGELIEKKPNSPPIITSAENMDWAVIQFEFDASLCNPVCFWPEPLSVDYFIQSEGFPAIRHDDKDRPYIGMSGKSHLKSDQDAHFQIDITSGYQNPNDSSGMSGSPIFDRSGEVIVGLFTEVPKGLDGHSIWALASSSMLADAAFNQLLTPAQKSPRYSAIRNVLLGKEFSDGEFRAFLISAFDEHCGSDDIEQLTAIIDAMTTRQVLDAIYEQTREACENDQNVDLPQIIAFCNALLPEFANLNDKESVAQYLENPSSTDGVPLLATTYEGIEVSMANYDQRKIRLEWNNDGKFSEGQYRSLKGELCIDFPEAAGGLLDGETRLKATEKSFYFQFCHPRIRQLLFKRLSGDDEAERTEALKRLQNAASESLRTYSEKVKRTRYFVPGSDNDHALLEKLAQACPYFLLLNLNDDLDALEEELLDYGSLTLLKKMQSDKDV